MLPVELSGGVGGVQFYQFERSQNRSCDGGKDDAFNNSCSERETMALMRRWHWSPLQLQVTHGRCNTRVMSVFTLRIETVRGRAA
jgi:hypothetical protein